MESFYRRPLPPGQIAFASQEGQRIFREALDTGGMGAYFALAEQFHTQAEPAFCALGTLVNLLNALAIDPGRLWGGPWRWFREELLDCCAPLEEVRARGLTLPAFACLARCNGAEVAWYHAPDESQPLREAVRRATAGGAGPFLAASYSRRALGQTGDGHFSPVGGYHAGRDLVLILDVARFKYPPHWVPLRALWEAMQPIDLETGKRRGYALLSRGSLPAPLLRVSNAPANWQEEARWLHQSLPAVLHAARPASTEEALAAVLSALRPSLLEALQAATQAAQQQALAPESRAALDSLLGELRHAPLFAPVAPLAEARGLSAEVATLLLLALAPTISRALPAEVSAALASWFVVPPGAVHTPGEVRRLQAQLSALVEAACCT